MISNLMLNAIIAKVPNSFGQIASGLVSDSSQAG